MSRLESEPRRFHFKVDKTTENQPSFRLGGGQEASLSRFETSLRQEPTEPPALPIERVQEALVRFDREDKPLGVLLQNAKILMDNQEFDLASHLFLEVLRRDSANELAIRSLGESYLRLKNYEKAEKFLNVARGMSPLTGTLLLLAETYYHQGKDEQALNIYNDVIVDLSDENEKLFEVFKNLGNIFLRQGDMDSAEEFYNKAFVINSQSDALLVNYGTLEIQRGQLEAALQRYRQAVDINPESDKAWLGLALIHREYGDMDLAWGNLQRALDIEVNNSTALRLLAEWSVKDSKVSSAIEWFEEYLVKNDQDAEVSFLLAKLFFIAGRFHLAELEAVRALNLSPEIEGGDAFLESLRGLKKSESMEKPS